MNHYQVGGSLSTEAPSYVERGADGELYEALIRGEFCYVLNCRQMGKSSLLVRTSYRLQQRGFKCSSLDMTCIGSENVTPLQWYKGILTKLWFGFKLSRKFKVKTWWQEREELSLLQRLSQFIEELLNQFPEERLFVFVDEIDSILTLNFPVDDFFALIRYCYNQRAVNPEYNRITFAIFGVATPSDLIRDKKRTPFNIGTAVELAGFGDNCIDALIPGLEGRFADPRAILRAVLEWTDGQPFLTQKLCNLLVSFAENDKKSSFGILPGSEAFFVEYIVQTRVIKNWESRDEPEHLRTIRDRILRNEKWAARLLGMYQAILRGEAIAADDSREQMELLLSGIATKQEGLLKVKNPIYREVFNSEWVAKKLNELRPYSQALDAWIASEKTDSSRLLIGQALREAKDWSRGKSLGDDDYQFLAASEDRDRQQVQQKLQLERALALEKASEIQRKLLVFLGATSAVIAGLAIATFLQYRQALESEKLAKINEIKATISSSIARFESHQKLDSISDLLRAKSKLKTLKNYPPELDDNIGSNLKRSLFWVHEVNRIDDTPFSLLDVAFSPDGQLVAGAVALGQVKIWKADGTPVTTLDSHATVFTVQFHPNLPLVGATHLDGTVKLWNWETGEVKQEIKAHEGPAWSLSFNPDGKTWVSVGGDRQIKVWDLDGNLLKNWMGHEGMIWDVDFSPDGEKIATASIDNTAKLWTSEGQLLQTFESETDVWNVAFSPDGETLATGDEKDVKLWKSDGTFLQTLAGHGQRIEDLAFSPDGRRIASASQDRTVRIWLTDGTLLRSFSGHNGIIRGVAFSPADSNLVASASEDHSLRLWHPQTSLVTAFYFDAEIWDIAFSPDSKTLVASNGPTVYLRDRSGKITQTIEGGKGTFFGYDFSPDGEIIAVSGSDKTVQLWSKNGSLLNTLTGHQNQTWDVSFSPDGKKLASVSEDGTVKLWRRDGTLLKTLSGHEGRVYRVIFSPDGRKFASAGSDGTVRLWNADGTPFKTVIAHDSDIFGLAAGPAGKFFATSSMDQTAKLWRWDGTPVRTFEGHENGVPGVDFSPDGRLLATGSTDRTVKLWTVEGEEIQTLYGCCGGFWTVKFSPDGKTLVTAADDRIVAMWDVEAVLNLDELAYACDWMGDYLRTNAALEPGDRDLCDRFSTVTTRSPATLIVNY